MNRNFVPRLSRNSGNCGETEFLVVLEKYLPEDYSIIRHQKSSAFVIDAVLKPKDTSKPQYMIEFKNLGRNANPTSIISAVRQISKASDWVGYGKHGLNIPIVVAVSASINRAWVEGADQ